MLNLLLLLSFLLSNIPLLLSYCILHKKLKWQTNSISDNYCTIATDLRLGNLIKYSFYILSVSYFGFIITAAEQLNLGLDIFFLLILLINSMFFLLFGWSVDYNSDKKHSYISRLSVSLLGITSALFSVFLYQKYLAVFCIALTILIVGAITATIWLIKSKNNVSWKIQLFLTIIMSFWKSAIFLGIEFSTR